MPSCAIITCRVRSQMTSVSKDGISFHRFPKEPNIKEKWIDATGRENWFPTKSSTICSKHFRANDYAIKKSGNKYLKPDAFPTEKVVNCCSIQQVVKSCNCNVTRSVKCKQNCDADNDPKAIKPTKFIEVEVKIEEESPSTSVFESNDGTELQKHKKSENSSELQEDTKQIRLETYVFSCSSSNASTPRKGKLKEIIATKENVIKQQRKQIKRIQAQNRRLKKKMNKIENELNEIQKKFAIRSEDLVVCALKTQVRRWTN